MFKKLNKEIKNSSKKLMNIALFSSTSVALVIYILMGVFCCIKLEREENVQPYITSHHVIVQWVYNIILRENL